MSGGSYNYAYMQIEQMAADLRLTTPLRRAFQRHLFLVSKACREIEWVDSGDGGKDEAAMRLCLGVAADMLILGETLETAKTALAELQAAIEAANTAKNPQ